jgi:transposase-like protein
MLKIPKLRRRSFVTAIIKRCRRREGAVREAPIGMDLAGVSVRRVEDIAGARRVDRLSPSTVSDLDRKICARIDAWRNRPIEGGHPDVFLDGIAMKRSGAGGASNVSLLVASAATSEGSRAIPGLCAGGREDRSGWPALLCQLVDRGLEGMEPIIPDPGREHRGRAARRALAALRRAFPPQRLHPRAGNEPASSAHSPTASSASTSPQHGSGPSPAPDGRSASPCT